MPKHCIYYLIFCCLSLMACQETSQEAPSLVVPNKESVQSVDYDSTMFQDAIARENALYDLVFEAVLDTAWDKDSLGFIAELEAAYGLSVGKNGLLSRFERQALHGYADSVYVVEYAAAMDSTCAHFPYQQQFIFNAQGQLLHQDKALTMQFLKVWEDQAPLLLMLNSSCKGVGRHHLYVHANGRLIDVLQDLEGATLPKTYLNIPDSVQFEPLALAVKAKDINADGHNDLLIEGQKLWLKDKKGRNYPQWRPFKKEKIRYVFVYNPVKELFFFERH